MKIADHLLELADSHVLGNYRRNPVAFTHGKGCRLWDTEGKSYLDFIGGIAVNSLGHAHPALTRALTEQASRYLHVSNLYHLPEQIELARQLADLSGLPRAFFCNSGTEANEAALKLARRWAFERAGPGKHRVLVAEGGFHGRTMGALAATANPAYHEGFQPLPAGFVALPYDDLEAWARVMGPDVCAVMLEVIQGEGGVRPASPAFLQGLQALCQEHEVLLLVDEVQTGVGRTGAMFAFEHFGLRPDVVTLAKGLGGGVPVGAMLCRQEVAVLRPGMHGCTFGGNALSCSAALAVLQVIESEHLLANAARQGERLARGLRALPGVVEVRGQGLLVGADLDRDAKEVERACLERGLLVNTVRPQTLRLAPPLVVNAQEVDLALTLLGEALA